MVHSPDAGAEASEAFRGEHAERPTVTVLRPDDPLTRPDDAHEAVTLTATVAAQGPVDWTDEASSRVRRRRWPRPRSRPCRTCGSGCCGASRTPADTAAATGAAGGSVPPPALAGAGGRHLHAANTTRLPGLLLAGGWAHPGGGIAHAGMSGALVAGLVVEGDGFRGSQ